jgi:glycosyltransferase involved in cell wall biosynthesis
MVSTFYPPYNFGGDGMHIYRLSNELAERGHSVDVFHCEDSYQFLSKKPASGDFPNHPNIKVRGLKSSAGVLSPLLTQQTGIPFLKSELKHALESGGYDVIHYNNMSLIGIRALSYGSAVKLYTAHEHWLVCPMHVLWKFNREVCKTKSCLSCQVAGGRPPQLWRYTGMMERMLKNVDCFLSPSRFTLNKHIEMGLDIPIRQMPYFLPTSENRHSPNAGSSSVSSADTSSNRRPFFLFVGRLEFIKGLQNIIPVFKAQDEYDLLIAGDGNYRSELEKLSGDDPRIKFLGRQSQDQLQGFYESAIAVIVPSICYETFGIIVIEAFSRKTPVIVNDLGALPEVVEDSDGGFVYSNNDQLLDAMNTLGRDRVLRDRLGANGFSAYMKYWNEDAHLDRYLGLVNELIDKRTKVMSGNSSRGSVAAAC